MANTNSYFDQQDPSILHIVFNASTAWEDLTGEITLLREVPPERLPVHLILHIEEAVTLLRESFVGRFSTIEKVFQDQRVGLRVCVHKSFEIRLLVLLFIRLYPAFKNRLYVTPTVEAAFALIQRERHNLG